MSTSFFNPTSPFGTLTGWEIQSNNPTTTQDRAQALKANGDENKSKLYNEKTSVSASYVASGSPSDTIAATGIPKFGAILNGYHVDSVSVKMTNTGFAQLDITGHKHGTANHPACRTYTSSLTSVPVFGCPASVPGVTIPSGAGVRSVTYTLDGNHIDEPGSSGGFLAAENHDGKETVSVELCDSGTITAATGWDMTSVGNGFSNTAAATASATVEKHLQGTAASST